MWARAHRNSQLIWAQNPDVIGPGRLCSRAATARQLLEEAADQIHWEFYYLGSLVGVVSPHSMPAGGLANAAAEFKPARHLAAERYACAAARGDALSRFSFFWGARR